MPAGRPSKYDEAYCDQVVQAGADGYSLTAFAGMISVSRDTISEWCEVHPEFSVAVKIHKAKRAVWWEQHLRRITADGGGTGSATTTIFALKNVAPDEFADRIAHTGPDGGAMRVLISGDDKGVL